MNLNETNIDRRVWCHRRVGSAGRPDASGVTASGVFGGPRPGVGADAVRPLAKRVWYAGDAVACNICGATARKFQQGPATPWELLCPYCYSRPRHRTAYRFFHERTDLFDGRPKRMLHVAPEAALAPKFRAIPGLDYLSGDLNPAAAMVQMDITDIRYPDNSFDVIYCSHVLEHVPDDRRAMRELARVLKPVGGPCWRCHSASMRSRRLKIRRSPIRKTGTGFSGNRIMCAGIARQISSDDSKRRDSRSRWIDLRSSSVISS